MVDDKTIAFYDTAAERYANLTNTATPSDDLNAFMALLPKGAHVLDLGCGPARASYHMRAAGFRPDPVDASAGMIKIANDAHNIGARMMTFDALDAHNTYEGVWANFSLLHAPRDALPRHLSAVAGALVDSGVFHIGMKTGTGEDRDSINRKYTYVTVDELRGLLADAGFTVLNTREGTEQGCAGTIDPFVIVLARKNG